MSDKEEEQQQQHKHSSGMVEGVKPPCPMAEAEEDDSHHQQQQKEQITRVKLEKMSISFSIWPPTQHTREAVIKRLVETLSTPSVLSKRYGSMPTDEASSAARQIEEEAFSVASSSSAASSSDKTEDDDGIEILQLYSKEISKRMLDSVKSRAAADNNHPSQEASVATDATTATPPASEEISSAQTESY